MRKRSYAIIALISLGLVFAWGCQNCGRPSVKADKQAADQGFINIDGVPLFYQKQGQGRAVIVVQGGPGLEPNYLFPHLAGLESFRSLVYYDQRATGRSGGEATADQITIKRFVADLEAVRQQLGLEKVDILAHSWGAILALSYALEHQENVLSLVLINPVPIFALEEAHEAGVRALDERRSPGDREALSSLYVSSEFAEKNPVALGHFFQLWFKQYFADQRKVVDLQLQLQERTASNALEINDLMNADTRNLDLIDQLSAVTVPALVIGGAEDIFPPKFTRKLADSLPNARYVEIADCGHFSFIEAPERVLEEVQTFYKKH